MHVRHIAGLLTVAGIACGALWLRDAWVRERRAKTVYPASEAGALLHPLRRLLQPPGRVVSATDIVPGHRVLELGPGPGYFTSEAARATGPRGSVIALDLQPAMLEELMRRLPPDVAARIDPIAGDAERLPLASGCIDRAFLTAVLGEVPDARSAVAEIARVLRPGGAVAFCETLTDPDYMRQADLRHLCRDAGLRFDRHWRQPLGYITRFIRAA